MFIAGLVNAADTDFSVLHAYMSEKTNALT